MMHDSFVVTEAAFADGEHELVAIIGVVKSIDVEVPEKWDGKKTLSEACIGESFSNGVVAVIKTHEQEPLAFRRRTEFDRAWDHLVRSAEVSAKKLGGTATVIEHFQKKN